MVLLSTIVALFINYPKVAQQAKHLQPFLSPRARPSYTRIPAFRPSLFRTCKQGFACWISSEQRREAMSFQKRPDGRIACTCEPIRQEVVCLAKTQKQEAKTRIRGRLFFLLALGHALSDPCDIAQSSSAKASASLSSIGLCPRKRALAIINDLLAFP